MSEPHILSAIEHESLKIPDEIVTSIQDQQNERSSLKDIKYLYLHKDDRTKYRGNYRADYYIGLDWLTLTDNKDTQSSDQYALQVCPKIKGINFLKMLDTCLSFPEAAQHVHKIYHIHSQKKPISIEPNRSSDVTLLIMVDFLHTLKRIAARGLKRGFIPIQENLTAKLKGKLLLGRHMKSNVVRGRVECNFCAYQVHEINCPENKLLKKAFQFTDSYLTRFSKVAEEGGALSGIPRALSRCRVAFRDVSDDINPAQVRQFKVNPLYREYASALRLAKIILKRFDYSIQETTRPEKKYECPPHIIDMPLLFELYVYAKFPPEIGKEILFQKDCGSSIPDFLYPEKHLILDTKYKNPENQQEEGGDDIKHYDTSDIAQLSRYARNRCVRKHLGLEANDEYVVECILIYPSKNKNASDTIDITDTTKRYKIKTHTKFYTLGIRLPVIEQNAKQ